MTEENNDQRRRGQGTPIGQPDFGNAEVDAVMSPQEQFDRLVRTLSQEDKVEYLLKTAKKMRGGDFQEEGPREQSRVQVSLDTSTLAQDLVKGLGSVLGKSDTKLAPLKRTDAQDIYEVCHWLMKAESNEANVKERIKAAKNKGGEITGIAKVSKSIDECDLEGEALWTHFVKLICETVQRGYLTEVPDAIQKPERVTCTVKARNTVLKRFDAFVWLASHFPEMKEIAGVGDLAQANMLLSSIPETMEEEVRDALAAFTAKDRTFDRVCSLVEAKGKRKRTEAATDQAIERAAKRQIALQRPKLRQAWPVNAVVEDERTAPDCQICGSSGHTALQCSAVHITAAVSGQTDRRPLICYNCQGVGHIARDCDKPRRQTNQGGVAARQGPPMHRSSQRCFTCNQEGHISRFCPNKNQVVPPPRPPDYPPPGFQSSRGRPLN